MKDVVVFERSMPFEIFQSFYLDASRRALRPNLVVLQAPEMRPWFEINAHGLKGAEVDPARRLVVVWGDSVVFGIGAGWVDGLDADFPGHQFLNGGLEGDPFDNICRRAVETNIRVPVAHNLLFPGWHSLDAPFFEELLRRVAGGLPGAVVCTVPTSLSEAVVAHDLTPYFHTADGAGAERGYWFWGSLPYTVDTARALLAKLRRQNALCARVAHELGVPLLDLEAAFRTGGLEDFRDDFFDAGHPRPAAYPKVQRAVREGLAHVLG